MNILPRCSYCGLPVTTVHRVARDHDWPMMFERCPGSGLPCLEPGDEGQLGKDFDMVKTNITGDKNCSPATPDPLSTIAPGPPQDARQGTPEELNKGLIGETCPPPPKPRRGRITGDCELLAMSHISTIIDSLPAAARQRVLVWITSKAAEVV